MLNSRRLSRRHGLNPCVPRCFYCNEDKNEILLFGKMQRTARDRDPKAPHGMVVDRKPCEKCQKLMEQGVILVSVRDEEQSNNPYRTGGWVVMKDDAIARILNTTLAKKILCTRFAFVPDSAWDMLRLPRGSVDAKGTETP